MPDEEIFSIAGIWDEWIDLDFSTGLTYEKMSDAVYVLTVSSNDERQIIEAARTGQYSRIKETDLFEFFIHQVSNLDNVESLLNDCLDNDGTPLAVRKSKENERSLDSCDLSRACC